MGKYRRHFRCTLYGQDKSPTFCPIKAEFNLTFSLAGKQLGKGDENGEYAVTATIDGVEMKGKAREYQPENINQRKEPSKEINVIILRDEQVERN